MLAKIKDWWDRFRSRSLLMHPMHTFQVAFLGITMQTQSPEDYAVLFGHVWGPKVYVVSKWASAACTALAAAGRSVLSNIDDPPKPTEKP